MATSSNPSTNYTLNTTVGPIQVATNPHLAESAGVGFVLSLILVASIVLNTLYLVIFTRGNYNSDKANYLLLNLCITDLIATVFWLFPSLITAAAWNWLLGDGFCQFQGVMAAWCYYVNMHTFLIIAMERCLRFWFPSKHEEVFYKTVVLVMISGIWIFDLVIALFPVMGWSVLAYSVPQFHCTFAHYESRSHLVFTFVVTFLIPLIGGSVFYGLTFYKIHKVKSQTEEGKEPILEIRGKSSASSYMDKYREAQKKLEDSNKNPENKSSKGTAVKMAEAKFVQDYRKKEMKSCFKLEQRDVTLTITLLILSVVYLLLWFPFIVMNFYWTYNYSQPPANGVLTAITLFTYIGLFIKPVIYVTNRDVRNGVKEGIRKPEEDELRL